MHICFLCNEYPPGPHGGIGSFTQTLGRALVARGHRVTVVGIYPAARSGVSDDQGVRVIRLPHTSVPRTGFLVNRFRLQRALSRINRESAIDVLDAPENGLAMVPKSFPAIKVIRMNGGHRFIKTSLGQKTALWRSWIERRSFARADYFCAVSRFVAETTRRLLRLGDCHIEVLPNPVDTERFKPKRDGHDVEERGLVLFTGTVCEMKGVRQLVLALPQIAAAVPETRLLIVGRDRADAPGGGSFTEYLRSLVPSDLRPRVTFMGHVENELLPELIAHASVCVYPSYMEAQGVVSAEGMAVGKAVVVTNTGPGPEIVEEGVSGLLCDPRDPRSIATNVTTLLKDDELRRRLGEEARARAVNQFSVAVLVERNEAFYRRCIRQHRAQLSYETSDRRDHGSLPL